MAWALVQSRKNATTSGTGALSIAGAFGSNVTTGNRIVLYAVHTADTSGAADVNTPTDSQLNTYTKLIGASVVAGSSTIYVSIWTAVASATGTLTITVGSTAQSGGELGWTAEEYSGLSTSAGLGCLDKSATGTGNSSSTANASSGTTGATTGAGQLAVSMVGDWGGSVTWTVASGTGFTKNSAASLDSDANAGLGAANRLSGSGSAENCTWSDGAVSNSDVAVVAVIKLAGGGGGIVTAPPTPARRPALRIPPLRRLLTGMLPGKGQMYPQPVHSWLRMPVRLIRAPAMRLRTGMAPGRGLSGIPPIPALRDRQASAVPPALRNRLIPGVALAVTQPVMAQQAVIRREPSRLVRAPAQRLRTGMTPVIVPAVAVRVPQMVTGRRVAKAPPQRLVTGMTSGRGLSGIPPLPVLKDRQANAVPLRLRNQILPGAPGSLTVPVPVPVTLRHRQKIRPVASRLTPSPFAPPFTVYQPVAQQTRLRPVIYRLVRRAAGLLRTGMTPGTGQMYPQPVHPALRVPSRLVRAPAQRLRPGMTPVAVAAPVLRAPVLVSGRRPALQPPARLIRGVTVPGAAASPVTAPVLRARPVSRRPADRSRLTRPPSFPAAGAPPVVPLVLRTGTRGAGRPVRGRLSGMLQAPPPPPPFTTGVLTATSAPASALTAASAPAASLTAGAQATGGPS